jgi:hypothetical protein
LAVLLSFSILSTLCVAQGDRFEAASANPASTALLSQDGERYKLSPEALQVAKIIGVEPLVARLFALTSTKDLNAQTGTTLEELLLRQQITDSIVAASLDVDSVLSKIDYEREQTVELRTMLLSQRERAIGSTNTAILAIGTGLGIVSSALSVTKATSKAEDAVGFVAGGLSTLLWFRSYRQQRGGKRPDWVLPDMLGPFFSESDVSHSYSDIIWTYLKSVPPGAMPQRSRKEQLLAEWQAAGRMGPLDSPQSTKKIALLTTSNAADKNLHLDTLSERGAMLADVRERVSLMHRDLRDLMQGLRPK